jgi:protein-disulfide isomerase
MSERTNTVLMLVAVLSALTTTGLVVRRELAGDDSNKRNEGRRVPEWRQIVSESQHAPSRGPATGAVTVVEFFDFQCPACRRASFTLDTVLDRYPEQVRVIYRHFPLQRIHPRAYELAVGGVCAARMGIFDEYAARVYQVQPRITEYWDDLLVMFGPATDTARINSCFGDPAAAEMVQRDIAAGERLDVRATPSFLINDRLYSGVFTVNQFDGMIAVARKAR